MFGLALEKRPDLALAIRSWLWMRPVTWETCVLRGCPKVLTIVASFL